MAEFWILLGLYVVAILAALSNRATINVLESRIAAIEKRVLPND